VIAITTMIIEDPDEGKRGKGIPKIRIEEQ
jgi:hypothetical protein